MQYSNNVMPQTIKKREEGEERERSECETLLTKMLSSRTMFISI
jgi:hypothetical protein